MGEKKSMYKEQNLSVWRDVDQTVDLSKGTNGIKVT